MATIYNLEDRRVIPNWRDFKRTVQLKELRSIGATVNNISIDLSNIKTDWNDQKNIGIAAEIINASFLSNQFESKELQESINLFESYPNLSSKSINDLIREIKVGNGIDNKKSILEIDVSTLEEFKAFLNNKTLHKLINRTKTICINEVRNPIIWIELARLYSMKGHDAKAENAINNALHLAPNNRFVLRSATRFFIHNKIADKALFYLKKSQFIKKDPWLVAAHIATSNVIGRFSPFVKEGISMINSGNYDPYDLTELASSIGSQEYYEGTFKKAKYFLNKSLLSPNDNTLAQLEWLSQDDSRLSINIAKFDNVVNPFEAYAFDYYHNGDWTNAFENSIKWFLDTPFSKRPILMASFIACNMLKDYDSAILLTKIGLQANPNDPGLLNNILYYSAMNNNLIEVDKYINRVKDLNEITVPEKLKIALKATLGLIALKRNFIDEGLSLYEIAIKDSRKSGNKYLEHLAILNLTKELVSQNHKSQVQFIDRAKSLEIDKNHLDLVFIKNNLLKLISRSLEKKLKN